MTSASETLALEIVVRLQKAGHTAYLAGGCVRDRIMGREPKDFDVATAALPEQILALYPRAQQVGVSFGVVLVRTRRAPDGTFAQVEVATFRADGSYSDGRRPDSVRFTDAREDAQRRDFTCNGLFLDPLANAGAGELHDFVGGKKDIDAKVLRAIGNPEERFSEDHLRMLRAVRFAGKLGFAIEPATLAAMQRHAAQIKTVSKERIHDELAMILEHASRAQAVQVLQRTGLLGHIWPEPLHVQSDDAFTRLASLPAESDAVMALAALQMDLSAAKGSEQPRESAPSTAGMLREALMLSNVETADLAWLLGQYARLTGWAALSKATLKRIMADPRWRRLETLYTWVSLEAGKSPDYDAFMRRTAELQAQGVAPPPFINGEALIKLGAPPGPAFRRWLEELYDRQLEGEICTQDEARAAARLLIAENAS